MCNEFGARDDYVIRESISSHVQRETAPKTLEVRLHHGETRQISADTIFINAGARPAKPAISGIENVSTLDSTSIMELDTVPEHLLIVGGGYIGLEFGQMFRRFGSQVTIVQRGANLLAREDADVADAVASIMREDGLNVLIRGEAGECRAAFWGRHYTLPGRRTSASVSLL